ncbi:siderophore-interacting protein [Actinoalloteichus hymeniacidonis]|uniref:Siderophore-interacting protein n=1 Tax=Actinoalloteichus hymeniacidonis TaxID=340345 RepID=A0AAC9HS52_9PSEU|nr:siderophore-interacting protein [Actinoalloteichus hymeniacidonis]AOS64375.1 siderophore-interacting protein [Actinoalloteichus hymeniacidonis]MBB5907557.1 NADPH-dependent ferric siderophore reductase [Actinoalloteichus hymeniacidonis]
MTIAQREIRVLRYELRPRLLRVSRVEEITPRTVRITFVGDDLPGFHTNDYADHVKLCFPEPGAELPIMPTLGERGIVPTPAGGPQPIFRDYTVRRYDADAGELDIDFVLHDHGIAGRWAGTAAPGAQLGVLGPRGSHVVPDDFDWYLLAGDETALPAIGRRLEELAHRRPDVPVRAFVEVDGPAEEQDLAVGGRTQLTWLHRDGIAAGGTELLSEALSGETLPADGEGYVWVAGEAGVLKPIRRHLRTLGLSRKNFKVDGYWKRGVINHDHHAEDAD